MMTGQPEDESEPLGQIYTLMDGFVVHDEASANWVVRKVCEARTYVSRVDAWAATETRRTLREAQWLLDRFGPQIEVWVQAELAIRGGKRRSLKLPAGQVGFRTTPQTFRLTEEPLVAHWCRRNLPDALRYQVAARGKAACQLWAMFSKKKMDLEVKDGVSFAKVKEYIKATGELPPGIVPVDENDTFYIR